MTKKDTYTWANHHAVLFCGDSLLAETEIKEILGIDSWTQDNDIVFMQFEDMGINDARQFKSRAIQRPYARSRVTFVIKVQSITREAQNSLLKLFEDTPSTAQFFVIIPTKNLILKTLLSRFFVHEVARNLDDSETTFPNLSESAELLTKIKDDDAYRDVLRRVLASKRAGAPAFQKSLLLLESYTDTKGASQKMLFEHALIAYYESRIERA